MTARKSFFMILSLVLACTLLCTLIFLGAPNVMPAKANGESTVNKVYFDNSSSNWENVYVFYWGGELVCTWPGTPMTLLDETNGIWVYEIADVPTTLLFSDGSGDSVNKTADASFAPNTLYKWVANNETASTVSPYSPDVNGDGICDVSGGVIINELNFPDATFLTYVKTLNGADDGIFTEAELAGITEINVKYKNSIADLTGIEHFTSITKLDCRNNKIKQLDLSNNVLLEIVICSVNSLQILNVTNNPALTELQCYSNTELTSLDVSNNTELRALYTQACGLTELDLTNNVKLNALSCWGNSLSTLDLTKNVELTSLNCSQNGLNALDVTKNVDLTTLTCNELALTSLDLSNNVNLDELTCNDNLLESLDLSNHTALKYLHCENNKLTSLDVTANTELLTLYCQNNEITELDVSKNTKLKYTNFTSNQLTHIDLSQNTVLSYVAEGTQSPSVNIDQMRMVFKPSEGFDANKVTTVEGATVSTYSNWFAVPDNATSFSYSYMSGFGDAVMPVTVTVLNPHKHDMDVDTHECACGWHDHWFGTGSADGVCSCGAVELSNLAFPSAKFREILTEFDLNGNGALSVAELNEVTSIVSNQYYWDYATVEGIKYFTNLEVLNLDTVGINELDLSNNLKLTNLDISNNPLTSLNLSNNVGLRILYMSDVPLTELDLSANIELATLVLGNNKLQYLDFDNTKMAYIIEHDSQSVEISITDAATYAFPAEMDASRVTVTEGATLEGNELKYIFGKEVKYTYFTGKEDIVMNVTLSVTNPHSHASSGVCPCGALPINSVNFPDETFRTYVETLSTDGDLVLMEDEIKAVTSITFQGGVGSLSGIEYFTALTKLTSWENDIVELDLTANVALQSINFYLNKNLRTLNVNGLTALESLIVRESDLQSIDVTTNLALEELDICDNEDITSLDITNNVNLIDLALDNTAISTLNVSHLVGLTFLSFGITQIKSIDLSNNTALQSLWCDHIGMTELDLSANNLLKVIHCESNNLTSLNVTNLTELTHLYCHNNELTSLDLSQNLELYTLWCHDNSLTSLDLTENRKIANFIGEDLGVSQNSTITLDESVEASLPTGVVAEKITSLNGATLADGKFVNINEARTVTYEYLVGYGNAYITVTLSVTNPHDHSFSENVVCACGAVALDDRTFPDGNFLGYVQGNFARTNSQYMTKAELKDVTEINVYISDIEDVNGIEYFTALEILDVGYNFLKSIDVSKNLALTRLDCRSNDLTTLDVSHNLALQNLCCQSNNLTSLDVSKNTALKVLICQENAITSLDLSENVALEKLQCYDNALVSLDLSANVALSSLSLSPQSKNVSVRTDSFNLFAVDASFDSSKATLSTSGASFDGNELVLDGTTTRVAYTYDTGLVDNSLEVTLNVEYAIDVLRNDLEEAVSNLNTLIAEKATPAEIESAVSAVQTAYQNADNELKLALQGEIDSDVNTLKGILESADTALQNTIIAVQSDLNSAKTSLSSAITNGDAALDEKITTLNSAQQTANTLISGLTNTTDTLSANLSALDSELASVESALQNAINTVEANLTEAKSELTNAIAVGDANLSSKITALDEAYKVADNLINAKLDSLLAGDGAISTLEGSLSTVKSELESAIALVQQNVNDLKAELLEKDDALAQNDERLSTQITVLIVLVTVFGAIAVTSAVFVALGIIKKLKKKPTQESSDLGTNG